MSEYVEGLLTAEEVHALEKGARQRARALVALGEAAQLYCMDPEHVALLAERIRQMSKAEARHPRIDLAKMVEWGQQLECMGLNALDITNSVDSEDAPAEAVVEEPAIDSKTLAAEESEVDSELHLSFRRVQQFYGAIARKTKEATVVVPNLPEEVETDEVLALVELYASTHRNQNQVLALKEYLIEMLQYDDATLSKRHPEHHNEYPMSFRYSASKRIAAALDQQHERGAQSADTGKVTEQVDQIEDRPPLEEDHTEPDDFEAIEETVAEARPERSIDEEPHHVRLAHKLKEFLDVDNEQAIIGLLDPRNNGEMTAAKEDVFNKLRFYVNAVTSDASIINNISDDKATTELVRCFTGLGYSKNGVSFSKDPKPLKQILSEKSVPGSKAATYAEQLYDGLEQLMEALKDAIHSGEKELEDAIPQLDFLNGKITHTKAKP